MSLSLNSAMLNLRVFKDFVNNGKTPLFTYLQNWIRTNNLFIDWIPTHTQTVLLSEGFSYSVVSSATDDEVLIRMSIISDTGEIKRTPVDFVFTSDEEANKETLIKLDWHYRRLDTLNSKLSTFVKLVKYFAAKIPLNDKEPSLLEQDINYYFTRSLLANIPLAIVFKKANKDVWRVKRVLVIDINVGKQRLKWVGFNDGVFHNSGFNYELHEVIETLIDFSFSEEEGVLFTDEEKYKATHDEAVKILNTNFWKVIHHRSEEDYKRLYINDWTSPETKVEMESTPAKNTYWGIAKFNDSEKMGELCTHSIVKYISGKIAEASASAKPISIDNMNEALEYAIREVKLRSKILKEGFTKDSVPTFDDLSTGYLMDITRDIINVMLPEALNETIEVDTALEHEFGRTVKSLILRVINGRTNTTVFRKGEDIDGRFHTLISKIETEAIEILKSRNNLKTCINSQSGKKLLASCSPKPTTHVKPNFSYPSIREVTLKFNELWDETDKDKDLIPYQELDSESLNKELEKFFLGFLPEEFWNKEKIKLSVEYKPATGLKQISFVYSVILTIPKVCIESQYWLVETNRVDVMWKLSKELLDYYGQQMEWMSRPVPKIKLDGIRDECRSSE